jgi:2-keto-4-pentenoate hydratase/2-oxohepta-3-ene-1,7-dioic acid hydratase in catechol pathway
VIDVVSLVRSSRPLRDLRDLLEEPDQPLDRLREAVAAGAAAAPSVALAETKLLAPVLQPPTVRDFYDFEAHAGRGARSRGGELDEAWFRLPIFYFSNPLKIAGPDAPVPFPDASSLLDYELELACVIGKEGVDVAEADGLDHIAGFTILNDWSARDLQRDEMKIRLGPAKGKDAATSLGPWVVTTDELEPYIVDGRLNVRCTLTVNGEQWMDGSGGTMHHTWGQFVQRASKDSRIVPGDVFGSGTVGGGTVGEARDNGYDARYLEPGDEVALTVEGIGTLRNTLVAPERPDPNYPFRAP